MVSKTPTWHIPNENYLHWKSPAERKHYQIDFSTEMNADDYIDQILEVFGGLDIDLGDSPIDETGKKVGMTLGGGVNGELYRIAVRIQTKWTEIIEGVLYIRIIKGRA